MEKTTRQYVVEWRAHDPDATAAEMARKLGVSRQRIVAILQQEGLPTRTNRSYQVHAVRPESHYDPLQGGDDA